MVAIIYTLCTLTALGCCVLLFRGYAASGTRLLFWSALCFAGLTLSNCLVVVDELLIPMSDLSPWRGAIGVLSVGVLLYGLVFEAR
jgi:hypothetical protein